MSKLSFKGEFEFDPFSDQVVFPVEIRKPNLALVKRALSTDQVDIPPGHYVVTATMPAGQQLTGLASVKEGEDSCVTLEIDAEDRSPHESQQREHYTQGPGATRPAAYMLKQARPPLAPADTVSPPITLRAFKGNLLESGVQAVDWAPKLEIDDQLAQVTDIPSPCIVQLRQDDFPTLNVLVPNHTNAATLVLDPDGAYKLAVKFATLECEMLLSYYEKGEFEKATALSKRKLPGLYVPSLPQPSDTPAMVAMRLVQNKIEDPIAATVGAYILLRLAEIEWLHDWTNNLMNWFEWLPDGITIQAEHLARKGKHQEARELLLTLPQRGMPYFADGLSYAVDRLRQYVGRGLGAQEGSAAAEDPARALLGKLQPFATGARYRDPLLTYYGQDPNRPGSDGWR